MYQPQKTAACKAQFDELVSTYGREFSKALRGFLKSLVAIAEKKKSGEIAIPAHEIFDEIHSLQPHHWAASWEKYRNSSLFQQLRAIAFVLRKRSPPCELWFTTRKLSALDGAIEVDVEVTYEVDHLTKTVRFLDLRQ